MAQETGRAGAPPTLLVTCGRCGDVVIEVRAAWVARRDLGRYGFACPSCHARRSVPAPDHVLGVLVCLGAQEITEERPPAAAPLTVDDLLDLAEALASVDDVAAWAS